MIPVGPLLIAAAKAGGKVLGSIFLYRAGEKAADKVEEWMENREKKKKKGRGK